MPFTNAPHESEARAHPLSTVLHKLQHHLYQTYLSPSSTYTQSSLFAQYAPLAVLLSILALPRYVGLFSSAASPPLSQILGHLVLGVCVALLALRGSIWAGARMAWAFCELDLGEHGRASEKIRGESAGAGASESTEVLEMELTQGNLIFGGLFG